MATRAGTTRTFTVSFPPNLAEQVEKLAAEEHRTTSELFREAFRSYKADRLRAHAQKFIDAAPPTEYGPEDVERLVDEYRAEQWALKQEKLKQERQTVEVHS